MRWIGVILLTMTSALANATVTRADFGKMPDGHAVEIYTLKNSAIEARIITYGARIVSISVPDRMGKTGDVVLGYNSLDGYAGDKKTYFGAIVGRYGNRIAGGKFTLDGKSYQVPTNDHGNALHGGTTGFDSLLWSAKEVPAGVEMTLHSPDGDMGFPGNLTLHVRYTLEAHALRIDYTATSDKDTVLNVTNHSYFNLSGNGQKTILNDLMMINADSYTPVNATLIPEGGPAPVAGTPFDFTHPTAIGERIKADNQQLKIAGGYDHNWILRGRNGEMKTAAVVTDPDSGRVLTVSTTEPGVEFYTGNFLDGSFHGKDGSYQRNTGLCLETQHFPDSPNQPAFPTTELKAGHTMHSTTLFSFSTK